MGLWGFHHSDQFRVDYFIAFMITWLMEASKHMEKAVEAAFDLQAVSTLAVGRLADAPDCGDL